MYVIVAKCDACGRVYTADQYRCCGNLKSAVDALIGGKEYVQVSADCMGCGSGLVAFRLKDTNAYLSDAIAKCMLLTRAARASAASARRALERKA